MSGFSVVDEESGSIVIMNVDESHIDLLQNLSSTSTGRVTSPIPSTSPTPQTSLIPSTPGPKIAIWNGKKTSQQKRIDELSTLKFLGYVKDNWNRLNDNKTKKKDVWMSIANLLEEDGYDLGGDGAQKVDQKWNNLMKPYKNFVKQLDKTGSDALQFPPPFCKEIGSILVEAQTENPIFIGHSVFVEEQPEVVARNVTDHASDDSNDGDSKRKRKRNTRASQSEMFMDFLMECERNAVEERKKREEAKIAQEEKKEAAKERRFQEYMKQQQQHQQQIVNLLQKQVEGQKPKKKRHRKDSSSDDECGEVQVGPANGDSLGQQMTSLLRRLAKNQKHKKKKHREDSSSDD